MKQQISRIILLAGVFALLFVPNTHANVPAWFVEDMPNNEAMLEPGTTTYCNKNFLVENMSDERAEVQVILGNGANYSVDQIEPKGQKSYDLTSDYGLTGGWESSLLAKIDDARIINTTGGKSNLKIHC